MDDPPFSSALLVSVPASEGPALAKIPPPLPFDQAPVVVYRKPRGGLIAPAGEAFVVRFSLCCGAVGGRKRATPPSLRFLGRRVYLGAVVILASVVAQALGLLGGIRAATGVPVRTTRRWLGWWRGPFLDTAVFVAIRARLVGVDVGGVPRSILQRLPGAVAEQVRTMLDLLAPITTGSVLDGARFLRDMA